VSGPICRNCHGRGHLAADCNVVICEKCGKRNDHFTQQCPTSLRCGNCGQIGHLRANCTSRAKYIYCPRCDSRNHTDDFCPLIWRSYVGIRDPRVDRPPNYCCYNCGSKTHYGDDCSEPRPVMLRFVEDTAFSGMNLPRELQREYFERNRKHRSRSPPRAPPSRGRGGSYGGSYGGGSRGGPPRGPSSGGRGGPPPSKSGFGARISKVKKKFQRPKRR
jgi:protein AIR1/2